MKNNASLIHNVALVVGDFLALVGAFSVAYILRVSLDHHRIAHPITAIKYLETFLILLPFFIILFALIGLYSKAIYNKRLKETGRIIIGSFIGILFIISYSYVTGLVIFPDKIIVAYGYVLSLCFLLIFRNAIFIIRQLLFKYSRGINNVLIVGDSRITKELINTLIPTEQTGYRLIGVVGGIKNPLKNESDYALFADFDQAVHKVGSSLHTIIQTELYRDQAKNSQVIGYAQQNHISYSYVPINSEILIGNLEVEIFNGIPVVHVNQTALLGWGRIVKRTLDLILAIILVIITSPIMLVISLAELVSGNKAIFFRQIRLTRYDQEFKVYKFRTQYAWLDGTTPEEAFKRLNRPDLITTYRENGDYVNNDPRVTKLGKFLKQSSLDELPQLFNIIKGDISLVGPRALIPQELNKYTKRYAILSVRSGLTGLAQVSGRRDISFEERRQLDLFYVQNWTIWLDILILFKTCWVIINHKGAK